MRVFIYGLCEPSTGEIRYVGSSSKPRSRLATHLSTSASIAVQTWCDELAARGAAPLLVILDEAESDEEASLLEGRLIAQLARPRLLNARRSQPCLPLRRSPARPARPRIANRGGQLFAAALAERGWSLNEAERSLKLSSGFPSRLANGRRLPGRELSLRLKIELGIDPMSWPEPAIDDAPGPLFISPTPPPAPTPPQCEPANSRAIVQAAVRSSASVQNKSVTQSQNATATTPPTGVTT